MLSTNMPIISLKKIDVFFGLINQEEENEINVDQSLINLQESTCLINFEKALREISVPMKRRSSRPERTRSSKSARASNPDATKVPSNHQGTNRTQSQTNDSSKIKKSTTSSTTKRTVESSNSARGQRTSNTATKTKPPTKTTATKRPPTKH